MNNPPPTPPRTSRSGSVAQRDMPFDVNQSVKDNSQWSVDRVFQAMDTSGDGSLSVSELHIGLTSVIGKEVTEAEAEKLLKKHDVNNDGELSLKEFASLSDAMRSKKSGMRSMLRGKTTGIKAAVQLSRESVIARELSKNGKVVTVSDLRLLKPITKEMIISLVYGMRFVENDFSCNGMYRASGTKSKRKPSALNSLLESGKRVSIAEFRSIAGQNGLPVASAITNLLYCYAPLIGYSLFDEVLTCKTVDDLAAFFEKNAPPQGDSIPLASYDFMCAFCIHLFDLSKFKDRNGMNVDQLCIPLAPILLRRNEDMESDKAKAVAEAQEVHRIFKLLICNAEELFLERDEFLWGARDRPDPDKMWIKAQENSYRATSATSNHTQRTFQIGGNEGMSADLTKADEVLEITRAGNANKSPSWWYVVPSSFIRDWLAYTCVKDNIVEGVSERPVKLDNTAFLGVQEKSQLYYLKEGLLLASDDAEGDFRLVNRQTYLKFCEMYPGSGPMICVLGADRDDFTQYRIDQRLSPYAKNRKVTDANEFDEYTTGDPVLLRNEGPDGLNPFQYVYRNSGLEDVVRGSAEALKFEEEEDFGEPVKKGKVEEEGEEEEEEEEEEEQEQEQGKGGRTSVWGGLFGGAGGDPKPPPVTRTNSTGDAELDNLLDEAEAV
eukprot:CAMPEP_0182468142 /NCGR_PEP_ID=MMETSP1319-20130603/15018_1 /TAXON_ID=172717 /ORGANISM="Bolidomonas pacifica, Strain RCC208" /LENGTH=663 /DNA_ID=CAMNT_0024668309 /DNA_START=158 /DNA_END=2146 /DNA_ORIENTATION=+